MAFDDEDHRRPTKKEKNDRRQPNADLRDLPRRNDNKDDKRNIDSILLFDSAAVE